MGRKVFISFLGTGEYKECCYVSTEKGKSKVVKYVQEAIIDLYCSDFTENDTAYIFLTKQAKEKNWEALNEQLRKKKVKIEPVTDLPNGNSEKEIWKIFEIVFNKLQEGDQIIFDITHGFRSLPMLGVVLLNYAKTLKRVTVSNILYGAFEALGPAYNIEQTIPNPQDRKAPLIDLTTFSAIQSWTFGAASFNKTGSAKIIKDLTMQDIEPVLARSQGKDIIASNIRDLMNSLDLIDNSINTNRGNIIIKPDFIKRAFDSLDYLMKDNDKVLPPIKPILSQIKDKLDSFINLPNWEASVQWSIDHDLLQQAITQLKEGIVTLLCQQHNLKYTIIKDREIVSSAFNILMLEIKESQWREPACSNKDKIREIMNSAFVMDYKNNFSELIALRNDINHGGYNENSKKDGTSFKNLIQNLFNRYKDSQKHINVANTTFKSTTLINLSNHPSNNWPKEQIDVATKEYGQIKDMSFPHIDPTISSAEVEQLAVTFAAEIAQMQPCVVHIMGEITFTYTLVNMLKDNGIKCIASTTDRVANIDNHIKTSIFKFSGFREY